MKLFIDTANIDEIKEAKALGIIDGVTTNPTLIAKEGKTMETVVKEICEVIDGPISVEAVSMEAESIVREARELSRISPNIVVKIPMTEEGLKATRLCQQEGIKTNVTLVFSPTQALLAAKAGATYVSPFVGRLDDISHYGMEIAEQCVTILENYGFETQVIVASIRHPIHVLEAAMMRAHVATAPYKVLKQLIHHPLTDIGLERFLRDWKRVPK